MSKLLEESKKAKIEREEAREEVQKVEKEVREWWSKEENKNSYLCPELSEKRRTAEKALKAAERKIQKIYIKTVYTSGYSDYYRHPSTIELGHGALLKQVQKVLGQDFKNDSRRSITKEEKEALESMGFEIEEREDYYCD